MEQVTITNSAIDKVNEIMKEDNLDCMLRVFVQGGGCSGFQYGFTFDEEQNDDDFLIEKKSGDTPIKIVVDSMSMQYLQGATIDFKEDLNGSQFVISNPNAKTTCGCGSSFEV